MTSRFTATLAVCLVAAAITGGLLFLPADDEPRTTDAYGQPLAPVADDAATAGVEEITIRDFAFGDPITVAAGAAVAVMNADGVGHTLTARNAEFDTGFLVSAADGTFVAPTEPGTYAFFCEIHPSMNGELIVG
jgi:plastocyanin